MRPAGMERERGRSAVPDRPLSRLVRGPGAARRLRLAHRGLGDARARVAAPPRMARARLAPRGVRLGGRRELDARRGAALRPAVLSVGGKRGVGRVEVACDLAVLEIEPAGSMDRIAALVARGTPVLAYGSHVRADLLRAARDAGAAAVPNSQVEERLRELLGTADGGLPG